MVDTRPLLKGFGAAADVIGQIATDKAVNSRRLTSISSTIEQTKDRAVESVAAIADSAILYGELVSNVDLATTTPLGYVDHSLGRTPVGAIVVLVLGIGNNERHCIAVSDTQVQMNGEDGVVTVWVF
jgi:F0F1-type ATP synthase assembly protein I